jgi:hypothetical protein
MEDSFHVTPNTIPTAPTGWWGFFIENLEVTKIIIIFAATFGKRRIWAYTSIKVILASVRFATASMLTKLV